MRRDPQNIAADIIQLAPTGIFDAEWYSATYPHTVADGSDPLVHFCNSGWLNGLNPSFYFDTKRYLAQNDDVTAAGINPLIHYLTYGEAENRSPSCHFDVAWYRRTYELGADESCLGHYLSRRRIQFLNPNRGFNAAWYAGEYGASLPEGADPFAHYILHETQPGATSQDSSPEARAIRESGLFDADYYRATYPEAAALGVPLLYHYCSFGWCAGQTNPNPVFNTKWYLAINDDVANAGMNPLFHYAGCGETENRRPCDSFDPAAYRTTHRLGAGLSCLAHYLTQLARPPAAPSRAETQDSAAPPPSLPAGTPTAAEAGVITRSELLDINYYLINYPDVRESGLDPLTHFCTFGWQEGRRPNPYFDPSWYKKTYLASDKHLNPLLHYIKSGEQAGHRPIVYFDPAWYRKEYGVGQDQLALQHFLINRRSQLFSPLKLFDVAWYISEYGAEIGTNRDPFAHYLRVGITKDINPGPDFDAKIYRAAKMAGTIPRPRPIAGAEIHEKLRREALNPLVHYLLNQFTTPVPATAA
jgi:hypothetical protein